MRRVTVTMVYDNVDFVQLTEDEKSLMIHHSPEEGVAGVAMLSVRYVEDVKIEDID